MGKRECPLPDVQQYVKTLLSKFAERYCGYFHRDPPLRIANDIDVRIVFSAEYSEYAQALTLGWCQLNDLLPDGRARGTHVYRRQQRRRSNDLLPMLVLLGGNAELVKPKLLRKEIGEIGKAAQELVDIYTK